MVVEDSEFLYKKLALSRSNSPINIGLLYSLHIQVNLDSESCAQRKFCDSSLIKLFSKSDRHTIDKI